MRYALLLFHLVGQRQRPLRQDIVGFSQAFDMLLVSRELLFELLVSASGLEDRFSRFRQLC
jgi:hypothetical protein